MNRYKIKTNPLIGRPEDVKQKMVGRNYVPAVAYLLKYENSNGWESVLLVFVSEENGK